MRHRSLFIGILITAAAVQAAIVMIPDIPLGIPGEWTWTRHALIGPLPELLAQFAPAIVGLTAVIFAARVGDAKLYRHHRRCVGDQPRQRRGPERRITLALLLGLAAASWIMMVTVQRCTPAPHRNLKSLWVLYDPSASGYFYEAVFRMDSVGEFLSSYESRMEEGEVYHVGTHPPGLFLLSRLAVDTCRADPALAEQLQRLLPRADLASFRALESRARLNRPLSEPELTALGLLSALTTLSAALAVIPLYFLLRRSFHALVAWRSCCLWPTVCCLSVFLPKSDVLFTLTSMASLSLGALAMVSSESRWFRISMAAASGLILWCGMMLSLAHLPVVVVLTLVFGIRLWRMAVDSSGDAAVRRVRAKECALIFATIAGSAVFATVVFSLVARCNMFAVWRLNLVNHAAFYEQHTRTAWKWLLVNPLELGLAIGLPLMVAAISGLVRSVRLLRDHERGAWGTLSMDVAVAVAITIGLLWLSCRNSGESARLWCFMTPWLILLPAPLLRTEVRADRVRNSAYVWHTLLLTQLVVCIITSARVNGFSI